MKYGITNQRDLRRAFWEQNSHLPRKTRRRDCNNELIYPAEVRLCFIDWIDMLARSGHISSELAQRATLEG